MTLQTSDRLGPYEILGPVGAGGMGEVYRARDTRLGRDVALKVLPSDHAAHPGRVRRFEHEARTVAALNHPNILALYDTGTENGVTYAVFELLEGQTLRALLQKGPVPVAKVADYGVQICHGLAAAHDKGIVHRDLKPENLFLTKDGIVKILDFGLARLARVRGESESTTQSQGTDFGIVLGTVGYMSPEQVRGEPADHRSDLFSLGSVLYEMLSGQRAFRGTSSVETLNAILKEEPAEIAPEGEIPPALERLVRHCLEKKPEDRFQSARDLAFELGGVTSTSGIGPRASAGDHARRGRWLGAGLIALAVGSAFWAGGFVVRRSWKPAHPTFKQITFRRGIPASGRFTPDGKTVVYGASWDDAPAPEAYSVRTDAPESRSLGLPAAQVAGVSSKGELAVLLPRAGVGEIVLYPVESATLARVPLSGGTPRSVADEVYCADWAPDGERLAALRTVGGVDQVEFPLGTVLARVSKTEPLLGCPRVSLQGDKVAFGTADGYRVIEVGSGRSTRITGITEYGHTTWWAWSADGQEIWFTASDSTEMPLESVSLGGRRRLLARVAGHLRLLDVSRDGAALLEHGLSRTRVFARAPGEAADREISVFADTQASDISGDGRLALLRERGPATGGRALNFVRETDGSPPMRVADDGVATLISPDGRSVVVAPHAWSYELPRWSGLRVVPTGPGETRDVPVDGLEDAFAHCFAGNRDLVVIGRESPSASSARAFLVDLESRARRPVSPPGVVGPCACDEARVVCTSGGRLTVYSFDGSPSREVPWTGPSPTRFASRRTAAVFSSRREDPRGRRRSTSKVSILRRAVASSLTR